MVPHIANFYPKLASRATTTTMGVRRSGLSYRSNRGLANLLGRGVKLVLWPYSLLVVIMGII